MSKTKFIESVVIDTLTGIQERKYNRSKKKPGFDEWFDYGTEILSFIYDLQDLGFELVLITGMPGHGKSYSMKTLKEGTNLWFNCDTKNVPWSGENPYGTKSNPTTFHKLFNSYNEIITYLKGAKSKDLFADNPVIFLMGHTELQKDGTYRLKTLGKMPTKMNIEGNFENCLSAEVQFEGEKPNYVFRTIPNGVDFTRTKEGMFEETYIPNDLELVKNKIRNSIS